MQRALVGVVVLVLLAALVGACPWSCPNGLEARQNDKYEATTNGCGPTGLQGTPPKPTSHRRLLTVTFVSEHHVGVHAVL